MRLLALLILLTICGVVQAAPRPDLVKGELLADVESIQPGQPFRVGVLLTINGYLLLVEIPGLA